MQCLLALVTSPSSCELESRNGALLHPQVFSPSASPQAYSDLLCGTLTPCKALQAPGQAVGRAGCLLAGLQPTLGWPLSGCETQRMLMGLFSLWCLALNRIGNCQIKQKATNPLSELISRTSTLFCYLSSLSRAAH